jgi:glutamate-5-semialdehyde dehydrogenase
MADGQGGTTPQALIADMGARARAAAELLRTVPADRKAAALTASADRLWDTRADVLAANAEDLAAAATRGLSGAMLDRLRLDGPRVQAICDALRSVAGRPIRWAP